MYKHEGNQLGQLAAPEPVVARPALPARRLADQEVAAVRPVLKVLTRCAHSSAPHGGLPVRGSDPVLDGSARFGATPNLGPVQEGSGPDQSSEPNHGNTRCLIL